MKPASTYRQKQSEARLSCAASVLLDESSTDEDRRLAELDLARTDDGQVKIDPSKMHPRFLAALGALYATVRDLGHHPPTLPVATMGTIAEPDDTDS